jgi:hypothetical protein
VARVQAEELPEHLSNACIDRRAFQAAQLVVGKYHRIGFPLRYWQNTKHDVDARAARRLLEGVCKSNLPDVRGASACACSKLALVVCSTG